MPEYTLNLHRQSHHMVTLNSTFGEQFISTAWHDGPLTVPEELDLAQLSPLNVAALRGMQALSQFSAFAVTVMTNRAAAGETLLSAADAEENFRAALLSAGERPVITGVLLLSPHASQPVPAGFRNVQYLRAGTYSAHALLSTHALRPADFIWKIHQSMARTAAYPASLASAFRRALTRAAAESQE